MPTVRKRETIPEDTAAALMELQNKHTAGLVAIYCANSRSTTKKPFSAGGADDIDNPIDTSTRPSPGPSGTSASEDASEFREIARYYVRFRDQEQHIGCWLSSMTNSFTKQFENYYPLLRDQNNGTWLIQIH